jgi:glutamyl-tRNA synthetase
MAASSVYFYKEFDSYEEKAVKKNFTLGSDQVLVRLRDELVALSAWTAQEIHQIIVNLAEVLGLNMGKVAQPLRVAICGSGVSPAIDVTLTLVGREKTLDRIDRAINYIRSLN